MMKPSEDSWKMTKIFRMAIEHFSGSMFMLVTLIVISLWIPLFAGDPRDAVRDGWTIATVFAAAIVSILIDIIKERKRHTKQVEKVETALDKIEKNVKEHTEATLGNGVDQVKTTFVSKINDIEKIVTRDLSATLDSEVAQIENSFLTNIWRLFSRKLLQISSNELIINGGDNRDTIYINHMILTNLIANTDEEFKGFTTLIDEWDDEFAEEYMAANRRKAALGLKIVRYFCLSRAVAVEEEGKTRIRGQKSYIEKYVIEMNQHKDCGIDVRYVVMEEIRNSSLFVKFDRRHGRVDLLDYVEFGYFKNGSGDEILLHRKGGTRSEFTTRALTSDYEIKSFNIFDILESESAQKHVFKFEDEESFLNHILKSGSREA